MAAYLFTSSFSPAFSYLSKGKKFNHGHLRNRKLLHATNYVIYVKCVILRDWSSWSEHGGDLDQERLPLVICIALCMAVVIGLYTLLYFIARGADDFRGSRDFVSYQKMQ